MAECVTNTKHHCHHDTRYLYLDVGSLIPNHKQRSHPISQLPATSSRTQPEKKADSLTEPKWKKKWATTATNPEKEQTPLLGARKPLIASTPLLTSICSRLSPTTGLPAAAEKKVKAFRVSGWLQQAEAHNTDGRSTSKAKQQSGQQIRCLSCKTEQTTS